MSLHLRPIAQLDGENLIRSNKKHYALYCNTTNSLVRRKFLQKNRLVENVKENFA